MMEFGLVGVVDRTVPGDNRVYVQDKFNATPSLCYVAKIYSTSTVCLDQLGFK